MLHSGFFLGRQYCAFARIARGQKLVDFLEKLTTRKLATPYRCGHHKARVYHLHNTTLYDAIEQRDVRFRKRMALGRALKLLLILDHVLTHREFRWLGSEQDKVAHFLTTTSLDRDALPRLAVGVKPNVTVRHFPDKLPIGISPDGRTHAFLYLLGEPATARLPGILAAPCGAPRVLPPGRSSSSPRGADRHGRAGAGPG